jgi:hypothetical protein
MDWDPTQNNGIDLENKLAIVKKWKKRNKPSPI